MTFPFAQSTLRMSAQSNTVFLKKFDFLEDLTLFFLLSLLQKQFNTELFSQDSRFYTATRVQIHLSVFVASLKCLDKS